MSEVGRIVGYVTMHRVDKMDTTKQTLRKEKKIGNLEGVGLGWGWWWFNRGRKDHGFGLWMISDGGEQLS